MYLYNNYCDEGFNPLLLNLCQMHMAIHVCSQLIVGMEFWVFAWNNVIQKIKEDWSLFFTLRSKEGLPSPPKHLNFSLHLYRYPPSTLSCSLTPPPAVKKSPTKLQGLPHLIRPVGGSDDSDSRKSTAVVRVYWKQKKQIIR